MQPRKRMSHLKTPLTFDKVVQSQGLPNEKLWIAAGVMLVWLIISILMVIAAEGLHKLVYPIIAFIVATTLIRYIVIKEPYFKKKLRELKEKDYKFNSNKYWNIYDITSSYPYICRFEGGRKAVFVSLDKDVIVGREDDNDYYHYEAITDAYAQMSKRGIECMHIDYMDTVGNDSRMKTLMDGLNNIDNKELQEVISGMYSYVQTYMQQSYASYDIYCFYSNTNVRDEVFWGEVETVIGYFLNANYIRSRILDKEEIGQLVKSVFNIDNFSVRVACESLFATTDSRSYIKPIWVERNGERKILNKTRTEIEVEKQATETEKQYKKAVKKMKDKRSKAERELDKSDEINLFDDDEE